MANFTESILWKKFMAKLYGLGASIVIVGALFKLQHWPFAGLMLTIGMTVEAVIFLFSAFEPLPHPDPRWELVYPELAGHSEHGEEQPERPKRKSVGSGEGVDALVIASSVDLSGVDTRKLASGLGKLGESAERLNELSEAVASAKVLSEKMQNASLSVENFANAYTTSSQVLTESIDVLADSYQVTAKVISDSGKQVGESVAKSGKHVVDVINTASESFSTTFALIDQQVKHNLESIKNNGTGYAKQVEALNKNMTALNTAYELQAQEANKYQKTNVAMGKQLEKLVEDLQRSAEENQTFRKGLSSLNESIGALNNIYGNMLSAMHMATKKKA